MIEDLRDCDRDATLACDVCIVGAGAAGITLARALAGSGLTLCLVESGGLDFEAATQALAAGANAGMPYYDLVDTRLRFFGGTTNIWGGRCVPLAPLDFSARAWVPGSGWPLDYAELEPWYTRAAQDFALDVGGAAAAWLDPAAAELGLDRHAFTSSRWRFDDLAERFNARRCADLCARRDLRILLHANLRHIQANPAADAVTAVELMALNGRRAWLCARAYVLACGGIENARLLLAARDVEPHGLGNRHDQVGRCFMEHPHARAGIIEPRAGYRLWARFQRRYPPGAVPTAPVLLPSPELQRELGVLNTALTFKLQRDPRHGVSLRKRLYSHFKHELAPSRGGRRLWQVYRGLRKAVQRRLRQPVERVRHALGLIRVHVMIRAEQAPNAASRVRLGDTSDALGMPLAVLDWRLSALDKLSVARLAARLDTALAAAGHGRLELSGWLREPGDAWPIDPTVGNHAIAGYHHMGTTRMSSAPAGGVVDADCRVHGYANLYLAGSSVFTTSGWANPTLTIVALAHRLAAHLRRTLAR